MIIACAQCGTATEKPTGHVNRSRRIGAPIYCSKACSGLARRNGKTTEQKKAEKAAYDQEYRMRDPEALKAKKAAYYQRTHDPVKEAAIRKERMPRHVEYCRRPEYRAQKKIYDRQYRAKKFYGDLAECALLVMDIRDECLSRMTDYEIRLEKGTLNKALQRKRDYERSIRNSPEVGPLGNLERGEGGQNGRLSRGRDRLPSPRNPTHDEHTASRGAAVQEASVG